MVADEQTRHAGPGCWAQTRNSAYESALRRAVALMGVGVATREGACDAV